MRKWPHLRKAHKSKKIWVRKFVDLRFAELIWGSPTFELYTHKYIHFVLLKIPKTSQNRRRHSNPPPSPPPPRVHPICILCSSFLQAKNMPVSVVINGFYLKQGLEKVLSICSLNLPQLPQVIYFYTASSFSYPLFFHRTDAKPPVYSSIEYISTEQGLRLHAN